MIYIKNFKKIMFHKYMSNNTNRRHLINNYLRLIEENNSNVANIVNVMNNQETTLRRLIFETNSNSPLYSSRSNYSMNQNLHSNRINRLRNPVHLLYNPSTNREDYIESLANIDTLLDGFLNAVQIIPSNEQINQALQNCLFSEINNPGNQACPISLRTFQPNDEVSVIKYCNHVFTKNDLANWFLYNTRCPLCRYDIRNYNNNQHYERDHHTEHEHDEEHQIQEQDVNENNDELNNSNNV